ncbi:class I SAM-dependent methyltransferase [soil metagenome]
MLHRRSFVLTAAAAAAASAPAWGQGGADPRLVSLLNGPQRTEANKVRDKFRHPAETLTFWGLKPGMTVVEIMPGTGGYWTEIIAPYLKATGGKYIGTGVRASRFADEAVFGQVAFVPWGLNSTAMVPAGTVDLVFTSRNVHDWMWTPGWVDKAMKDFHAALKPGGLLGVEDHRADSRPMVPEARDGYVSTAYMVGEVEKAGFKLDGKSEINANPKDTKDHPFGVWTLPPTRRDNQPDKPKPADFNPAKYEAIGESDRMTLRFKKA